jgi:GNAT superfamily N-acetyltransferase
LQSILEDINKGYCIVAKKNNIVTGTGAIVDNYIKSVYVHPSFQRMGIGSLIIKNLEQYSLNNNVKEI